MSSIIRRVIVPYVVFAALWILLSDLLLEQVIPNRVLRTELSIFKGLAFVLVTAVLLYFLQRMELRSRQKTEAALEESERNYREIFNATHDAIFVHDAKTGAILDLNRSGSSMFGISREQARGLSMNDISSGEPPYSQREAIQWMRKAVETGSQVFEWRCKRRNGELFWAEVALRSTRFGAAERILAVVRDITERQRAEASLRESEARLRTLVETAPTAIFVQTEGCFAYVNAAALELFGASSTEQLLGKPVLERFHPDYRDSFAERIRLLSEARKTSPSIEERCLKMDGSPVDVDISTVSFPYQNQHGTLVFAHDITEHKLVEEALKQVHASLEFRVKERTAELAVAKERAEESDRLKSAFLATMSHELRTPLNSIIGFTGILLQGLAGPLNEEQNKQLDMVRSSARHLLALINDVLDISKIEAGQLKVNFETFLLQDSIAKTLATVRPLAGKKGLTLRAEIDSSIGEVVSDSRRVEQVLLNLMNNAIKFTERGEVALSAVILSRAAPDAPAGFTNAAHQAVRFQVSDTGIGIKPEDLACLFLPFRQVDCGLTRHHEGTGLGLTICRRLADLLGGEIQVASEFGKGSTFTFFLPLKPASIEKPS